jgi:Domain of Unknown Function (DUF326)
MWKRREILGLLGTGAAGLALVGTKSDAQEQSTGHDDPKHAGLKKSCCDACGECAEACNKAFHHSIEQGSAGKPRYAKLAQTVADCAAFCALSAQMIGRHSMMMTLSCRACADACRRCAQECELFDTDIDVKLCTEACQRCEESCRNMIKAMGDDSGSVPKTR